MKDESDTDPSLFSSQPSALSLLKNPLDRPSATFPPRGEGKHGRFIMSRQLREIQNFLYHEARRRPFRPLEHVMRFVTDWAVLAAAWSLVRAGLGAGAGAGGRSVPAS